MKNVDFQPVNYNDLHESINQPNVMIKVPGTNEGLPVIEKLISLGINVNENHLDFPLELQKKSISLKEIKGHPIQREPLLASIFNELDLLINTIDTPNLIASWMDSCNHKNIRVEFFNNKQPINGIFKYINEKGQAIINYNNENIHYDGAISIV